MGKLTDIAGWTERMLRNFKGLMRPASFKESIRSGNAQELLEEAAVYKTGWQIATVGLLAKFAKADGAISKAEIRELDGIFKEIDLAGDQRTNTIKLFNNAKSGRMTLYQTLLALRDFCNTDIDSAVIMVVFLFRLAHAEGEMSLSATDNIHDACKIFGLSYEKVHSLYVNYRSTIEFEKEAYSILGCVPSDSDEVIKCKYRELVKEFHPDHITPTGLASDVVKFGEEKFKRIQAAYEVVIRERQKSA